MQSLRELRKDAGLTQKKLALLLSRTPFTIIRWEKGQGRPGAADIRRLAWALRVDESIILEALIDGREQQQVS
jgi:transcriptional regulator with XRE-family HTH domain